MDNEEFKQAIKDWREDLINDGHTDIDSIAWDVAYNFIIDGGEELHEYLLEKGIEEDFHREYIADMLV